MDAKKCECWDEAHPSWAYSSGVCNGTKERDACDCGGDERKCDFYPERREKAGAKMGELKPCPFCGGKAVVQRVPYKENKFVAFCRNRNETCKAEPCTNLFDTREEAAEVWNTRAETAEAGRFYKSKEWKELKAKATEKTHAAEE